MPIEPPPEPPLDLPPRVTLHDVAIIFRLLSDADKNGSGAYTRVAREIGKSRAYINERIDHVEKELDTRLLERADNNWRQCELTRAGHIFRKRAALVLVAWQMFEEDIHAATEAADRWAKQPKKPVFFVGSNRTAGRKSDEEG